MTKVRKTKKNNDLIIKELKKELKDVREELKRAYSECDRLIDIRLELKEELEKYRRRMTELNDIIKDSVRKDFCIQAIAAASGNNNN